MAVGPREALVPPAFAVMLVSRSPSLLAVLRIVRGVHVQDHVLGQLLVRFQEDLHQPG